MSSSPGRTSRGLLGTGFLTGALSGFFGIGGGFLIVPGLMFATGMPIINAVGSSLVAVTAFGATAAFNYARLGPRRLAARRLVHPRRGVRRARRRAGREGARRAARRPQHGFRRHHRRGGDLHAGAQSVVRRKCRIDSSSRSHRPSRSARSSTRRRKAPMCRAPTSRSFSAMAPGPARTAPSW